MMADYTGVDGPDEVGNPAKRVYCIVTTLFHDFPIVFHCILVYPIGNVRQIIL